MGRKTNAERAEEDRQKEEQEKAFCLKKYVKDGYHYYVKWTASSSPLEGFRNPGAALTEEEALLKIQQFCDEVEKQAPMPEWWGPKGGHCSRYCLQVMFWNGVEWAEIGDKKYCIYYYEMR